MRANEFVLRTDLHTAMVEELDLLADATILTDALDDAIVTGTVERLSPLLEIFYKVLVQRYRSRYLRLLRNVGNEVALNVFSR